MAVFLWLSSISILFLWAVLRLLCGTLCYSFLSTKHEARSTKHEARSTKHEARSTKHEARSTKHEARSTKHEARSTKHEARSTKHEARSTKHEARSTNPSSVIRLPSSVFRHFPTNHPNLQSKFVNHKSLTIFAPSNKRKHNARRFIRKIQHHQR